MHFRSVKRSRKIMIPKLSLLLCVLTLSNLALADPRRGKGRVRNESQKENNREGKLFSLFTIINFQNSGCQSTSTLPSGQSQFRNGTCYTTTECQDNGGRAQGSCAAGFGVCCIFLINSATEVSQNCSYLQNPSFPGTDSAATAAISYTINKASNEVCTLRLDFETFTLRGTAGTGGTDITDGQCTDTFTVTATTGQTVPVICGLNSGYHMYVDIGSTNSATAAFAFSDTITARQWDIKVSQIECNNPSRPPNSCLQYHTGLTGRLETFNFQNTLDNHLNAQNYAICIRAEAGMCCVQYQICPDQASTVVADGSPGFSLSPEAMAPFVDDNCATEDYIGIDTSAEVCLSSTSTASASVASRYCGAFLNTNMAAMMNAFICDCTPPFAVDIFTNVVSDDAIAANANTKFSHGVCLEYMQVPC